MCGVPNEGVLNSETESSKQTLELVGDGNVYDSNDESQTMIMAEDAGQSIAMSNIPAHAGGEDIMCGVPNEGVLNLETHSSKQELELVGYGNVFDSNEEPQRMVLEGVRQAIAMSIPAHAGAEDMCGFLNEGVFNLETQSSKQALEVVGYGNVCESKPEESQRMMAEGVRQFVLVSIPAHAGAEDTCGFSNEGVLNLKTQSSKQASELVGDGNVFNSNEESHLRMLVEGARQSVAMSIPAHVGVEDMCGVPNEGIFNLEAQSSKQALELVGDGNVFDSNEESQSRQTQEKNTELGFRAHCVPILRILSATLYLFDVVLWTTGPCHRLVLLLIYILI